MTREFQVTYRTADFPLPQTLLLMADGADQARAVLARAGYEVLAVTFVRPVLDWAKPVYDQDEAAAYLGWQNGTLSANKATGRIPFTTVNGAPRYLRAHLDRMLFQNSNDAGKKLALEMEGQ